MSGENVVVADHPESRRYEIAVDGKLAGICEYNLVGDAVMFTHTEVYPGNEGKGLGGRLAKFVLDDAKRQGKHVIPVCLFIAKYIREHAEFRDLVRDDIKRAFKI
jgi:predicted GNAT family acetyltransferase